MENIKFFVEVLLHHKAKENFSGIVSFAAIFQKSIKVQRYNSKAQEF